MAGISSKAANITLNKEKTFQGQRFDDDFGLNWDQFKWRNHDPQIGRFIEIDPLSEKYVYNSVYAFSENNVIAHVELEGLEKAPINKDNSTGNSKKQSVKETSQNKQIGKALEAVTSAASSEKQKTQVPANPITNSKPISSEEDKSLMGSTSTDKIVNEHDILSTGVLGDKITVSSYVGKVTGKEGALITTDVAKNKGKFEGASINLLGFVTLGVNSDLSMTQGVGMFGYEIHVGRGLGIGLGQFSIGASHTDSKGIQKGGDLTIRPGVGAALAFALRSVGVTSGVFSMVK